jgi:hypothetical protein
MFLNHPAPALPFTLALWTPPHRRIAAVLAGVLHRLHGAARRAAERHAARRDVDRRNAMLSALDAHTLRDIGLGDWAASARDADDAIHRRTLELRGF